MGVLVFLAGAAFGFFASIALARLHVRERDDFDYGRDADAAFCVQVKQDRVDADDKQVP